MSENSSQTGIAPRAANNDTSSQESADTWIEIKRSPEGVSLSVYETDDNGNPIVADETWWTWAEFTGIDTTELPISVDVTTSIEIGN